MVMLFFTVFGFGIFFVAFGVTETVNVQFPAATPFTVLLPSTTHFFLEEAD